MSEYLERYSRRMDFWGSNATEQFKNIGTENFLEFLKVAPSKMYVNGTVIGASYTKSYYGFNETTDYLLTKLEEPQSIGAIVKDYSNREWLVATSENLNPPSYNRYKVLQCNDSVETTNEYGETITLPCLVLGTLKSTLKETFKLNNEIILPQENGSLMLVLSNISIEIGRRMILGNRAWKVVGYDDLSATGLLFLSLEQDKIDKQTDDMINKIADNEIDNYTIQLYNNYYRILVGSTVSINYVVYKNGKIVNAPVTLITTSNKISINGDDISGVALGATTVKIAVDAKPTVYKTINVDVVSSIVTKEIVYDIVGDSYIKWGRTAEYSAIRSENGELEQIPFIFSIQDDNSLVTSSVVDDKCVIVANSNNIIGEIILTATFQNGEVVHKTINIVSLWG